MATVLLDATPAGAPLYASLGFEEEDDACLYTAANHVDPTARPEGVIPLGPEDVARIVRLDAPIFGADRGRLLGLLLGIFAGRAFGMLDARRELTGFVIAQEQRIGPWVARDAGVGEALLAAALSVPFDGPPIVIVPGVNGVGRAALARHGFVQTRSTRHMRRGPAVRTRPRVDLGTDELFGGIARAEKTPEKVCKPGPVSPRGATIISLGRRLPGVSSGLTRERDGPSHCSPIRPCSGWGLPSRRGHPRRW